MPTAGVTLKRWCGSSMRLDEGDRFSPCESSAARIGLRRATSPVLNDEPLARDDG